jgi:type I restriction enzyme S subunit
MLEKNDSLRRTRDLLLPKLISGELDVNDLPIDVASENYQDIETGV